MGVFETAFFLIFSLSLVFFGVAIIFIGFASNSRCASIVIGGVVVLNGLKLLLYTVGANVIIQWGAA